MVRNCVRRDVGQPPAHSDTVTNNAVEAGVQTSYVHSSTNNAVEAVTKLSVNEILPVHGDDSGPSILSPLCVGLHWNDLSGKVIHMTSRYVFIWYNRGYLT